MRALGIDYGEKRIGLAVSDEMGLLARELSIVSPKNFFSQLPQLLAEYTIGTIVLGLPLNMQGEDTEKTREVKAFKHTLEQLVSVPVEVMDERLSSQMAAKLPGGHERVDSLAAQIILQNYLDMQQRKR